MYHEKILAITSYIIRKHIYLHALLCAAAYSRWRRYILAVVRMYVKIHQYHFFEIAYMYRTQGNRRKRVQTAVLQRRGLSSPKRNLVFGLFI